MTPGLVSIVGAGPGDPGLLTLRAAERLRRADAVVFDALVGPGVLALVPAAALRFDVGRRCGGKGPSRGAVERLLIRLSRHGLAVVRLKGGDPFVFGRGAEEADALAEAGLPCEVVPGVSSCIAAPAAAGIPVTDRRASSMLTVVTAHECGRGASTVAWESLSPAGTLVVMMGLSRLGEVCERLVALGWPADMPAAAVASAGWPAEAVAVSDLAGLPAEVARLGLKAPAVVVVGNVVRLRRERAPGGVHVREQAPAHP